MIQLTRMNNDAIVVNGDLLVHIEANPDTVLLMMNGDLIKVRESMDEVVRLATQFKQEVNRGLSVGTAD